MNRPRESADLYVGLMSGTSMDGIDAAIVALGDHRCEVLAGRCFRYPEALRRTLIEARSNPGTCDLDDLGRLDHAVGECFADAALALLGASGIEPADIVAVGSHGQTLRHQPTIEQCFTLQIGDPNIIAARTGITTVADFRRADMAVGGQGAPLAPAFHRWLFADSRSDSAIVNIGGIANLTVLPAADRAVVGFDTGPGNTLLDAWIERHEGSAIDRNGAWAAGGDVSKTLLAALAGDAYFALPPPKSTGFEYFNLAWLEEKLGTAGSAAAALPPRDVQATLCALTARTIAEAVRRHAPGASRLLVCGGGVHNDELMRRVAAELPAIPVGSTGDTGLDPDWVEAAAFAWLARRRLERAPGNLPSVTGAAAPVLLGGVYRSTG